MKNKVKDFFNTMKYKRKANKMENNYKSALEEIDPLKTEIIELQRDKIALIEKYNITKKELKELKRSLENNEKR